MNIISVREQPQYAQQIIAYLQQCWSSISPIIYSDCVNHCIWAVNPLPQWYVLEKAKDDARKFGFANMYLSTDHIGHYEKYGFCYIGDGYHPWDEQSRIYKIDL